MIYRGPDNLSESDLLAIEEKKGAWSSAFEREVRIGVFFVDNKLRIVSKEKKDSKKRNKPEKIFGKHG